jgi:DNA-binding SARP family transcriptional activator
VLDAAHDGWQDGTLWDPARFGPRHAADIERLAVAGDPRWDDWVEHVTRYFRSVEFRVYEGRKQAAAWGWVKA